MCLQENVLNNTQSVLIDVLRAFALDNQQKPNTDSVDMNALFKLAKKHSVVGMVAYTLNRFDLFKSPEQKDKYMHEYDRTVMNMLSRETSAVSLCKSLQQKGIEHILFKGMMVSAAYPVPALRTYGDVDIIIRKSDVEQVKEYLVSLGYRHSVADAGVVNVFDKHKEHYEFHTNLNVSNLKDSSYFDDLWDKCIKGDICSFCFEHSFHLCYLITHLEKHVYGSGAGIRMYLDIALYIKKYKNYIDLEKVHGILSSLGLGVFFDTVLFVCNKWFDLEIPDFVPPLPDEVYEQMCDFTFTGGVFGDMTTEKNAENALRRQMSDGKRNARIRFVLNRIFPPFSELSRLYPKYSGKPWLAPIAWFNHIYRFFRDRKYGRLRVIASADTTEALAKKEFLESIGSVH